MKFSIHLLFIINLLIISCKETKTPEQAFINDTKLLHDLKVISHDSMEGRSFGSPGNNKARTYLASQFDSLGLEPAFPQGLVQSFRHSLTSENRLDGLTNKNNHPHDTPIDSIIEGANVVAKITGKTEQLMVITAHFDHVGMIDEHIFNGADDNASGAAALLTIANHFNDLDTQHTLVFAALDGEELGSIGAQHLIENFPYETELISLNVNMDMIAHNDNLELVASGTHHYPFVKQPLETIESPITLIYGHDIEDTKDPDYDWTYSSDHVVFHEREIPYIYFGVEDHSDYHTPQDTFEHINPEFYVEAVQLIIRAIEAYDTVLING